MKPTKRTPLASRITPEDLKDYLARRISTADIAEKYGTTMEYAVRKLPKRPPNVQPDKKALRQVRKEFRLSLAARVHTKELTIDEACDRAHCSVREMYRCLSQYRNSL